MALRMAFGELELDEPRFELRRRGARVTLQPKVLDLILYLAKNRHRVVDKDELFDAVWEGAVVTEASLNRAVSLARKALDDTPNDQRVIRTVRGKGLQFVAAPQTAPTPLERAPRSNTTRGGGTERETVQDELRRDENADRVPFLYAVLHGEAPSQGAACWSLAETDEVQIVRGSRRRSRRELDLTRVLTIALPGTLLSRQHARFVRTPETWLVVDGGSRNGTFVNGERVAKRDIEPGDLIECGRTVFLFGTEPATFRHAKDLDEPAPRGSLLASVTPSLRLIEDGLSRVAASSLSILFTGESGTGKSHLAEALHRLSGRSGDLAILDASTMRDWASAQKDIEAARREAGDGTILIENVDRVDHGVAPLLTGLFEPSADARVVCTSRASFERLQQQVPRELSTRLSGFRCELPPLRERAGDLGALIAAVAGPAVGPIEPAAALALLRHSWPGNLRELALVLGTAAVLAQRGTLRLEHLPAELRAASRAPA